MRVKVLGSAAGGGFPQWNCGCRNCSRFRGGSLRGSARTQTQIAVNCDTPYSNRSYWMLVNASPDLRAQILATRELNPFKGTKCSTPVRDVYLPSADVDSLMGLLHLREFQGFNIYAMPAIRRILADENAIFRVLGRAVPPVQWFPIPVAQHFDGDRKENPDGVQDFSVRAVPLGGEYPDYIGEKLRKQLPAEESVVGLVFEYGAKRVFIAPTLPGKTNEWKKWAQASDLVLMDGTFWSDDELKHTGRSVKTARQIGHLPLSGTGGLLEQFPERVRGRKVLVHINNTNPILDEESAEHRAALDAGFEIAYDGMEIEL